MPVHRLGIVAIGKGVGSEPVAFVRKLRPEGTYFTRVSHADGMKTLTDAVAKRAAQYPARYRHWYIEGGTQEATPAGVTPRLLCRALAGARGLARPNGTELSRQCVRSGGVSNPVGTDTAARGSRVGFGRRCAQPVTQTQPAQGQGPRNTGLRHHLRAMGGEGSAAARAARHAVCAVPNRGSGRTP